VNVYKLRFESTVTFSGRRLVICFERKFPSGHVICNGTYSETVHRLPFGISDNTSMVKIEPYDHERNSDPPAAFATDAEIEIAERLRRKLEARYLAESEAAPPLAGVADDDGEEPL